MNVTPIDILAVLQEDWVMAGVVEPDPMPLRSIVQRHMEKTDQHARSDVELDNLETLAGEHIRMLWGSSTISQDSRGCWLTDEQEKFARSQLKDRAVDLDDEGQLMSYREIINSMSDLSPTDLLKLIRHATELLQGRV